MNQKDIITKNRKLLYFRSLKLKNLDYVGVETHSAYKEEQEVHAHENNLEICYIHKGFKIFLLNNEEFHLKGGDVFVTLPNEKHGSGSHLVEKGTIYWIQINLTMVDDNFLIFQGENARVFIKKLLGISNRHFSINQEIKKHFDQLFEVGQEKNDDMQEIKIYSIVIQILLNVIETSYKSAPKQLSKEISKSIQYIDKNIMNLVNIDVLSNIVHLSPSHFKKKFKAEVGATPADFIQRQKINYSKKELSQPNSNITKIAISLGYSSAQHFSYIFKKYTGKSPAEFKRNN
jgi:AraC-like DNA-binding protein